MPSTREARSNAAGTLRLTLQPITFAAAKAYIAEHHRHHLPPQGWRFGVSVVCDAGAIHGVITIGRPVSRHLDDGHTAEVTRCCTDGARNACSLLYAAAWRASRALGYRRLITYTLDTESGVSLRAAGWKQTATTAGGEWSSPSRPRATAAPTCKKLRWEAPNHA